MDFSTRSKLLFLAGIMGVAVLATVSVSSYSLYEAALDQQQAHLAETVQSYATLIEAVAEYAYHMELHHHSDTVLEDRAFKATMEQLRNAHSEFEGLGRTGEFTLATISGGQIVFLLSRRHHDESIRVPMPLDSKCAEPMRLALSGKSGTMIGRDYRGATVMAAYQPIDRYDLGIVAKIDLAEIQEPFVRAGALSFLAALLLISTGSYVYLKVGSPIIRTEKETKELFRNTFEQAAVGIAHVAMDGQLLRVNQVFCDIVGYTRKELLQKRLDDLTLPDDLSNCGEDADRLLAGNIRSYSVEKGYVCENGRLAWINLTVSLVRDEKGEPKYFIAVIEDVTSRKHAQEALISSEGQLRAFFEGARDGILVADSLSAKFVSANDAMCRMLGYTLDEIKQLSVSEIHPPASLEHVKDMFDKQARGETALASDLPVLRKDGTVFPADINSAAFELQGRMCVLGIFRDITDRKQKETELRQSDEKFRAYIDNAPAGVFVADAEARYVDVKPAACRLTGYTREELLNMSIPDISDPKNINNDMQGFAELKHTGKLNSEIHLIRKDGTSFWSSLDAVTLSNNAFMGFCTDITETKRLMELESRAQRLESAGKIAGQIAHDFNNLLAPLIVYPDFIRKKVPDNHHIQRFLNTMETSALLMAEINQQLLTLGRRGHYNQTVLDLNGIVKQTVGESNFEQTGIEFHLDLCEDLMMIKGGKAQLHRVVINLLNNAMDAIKDAGTIIIRTENYYIDEDSGRYGHIPTGEYVKLTISDDGCGIAKDIIGKIFDPFFTSKSTDGNRGSGLGLSVVDAVVKDHHAYLDLNSRVGLGSTFYLYFPITRDPIEEQDQRGIVGGTEHVLVVDDDEIQREVSSGVLEMLGYSVSIVTSGEEAIEFVKDSPPDILVLDMVMPLGIDGTETYRRILDISPKQRAIILSGFSETVRVRKVLELGAGAFVKKPVTTITLANAVRKELDRTLETATVGQT